MIGRYKQKDGTSSLFATADMNVTMQTARMAQIGTQRQPKRFVPR